LKHGWVFTTKTGLYGVNYIQRALITAIGLGANRPQDAVYPTSEGPSILSSYTGEKKYVMHFDKGQLPPANGFWSLTMYDKDYFFVQNPINRQSISARQNLKFNTDGSVDLYIQNESPGADKESNWLPAPKDKFILMMRLYWPKETPPSILDGTWTIPPVKAVDESRGREAARRELITEYRLPSTEHRRTVAPSHRPTDPVPILNSSVPGRRDTVAGQ